jgi:membrane-bound metal-dependent hydrolase YbcI (DUF457 family)
MDVGTHALLSLLLARAVLPRAPWAAWLAVIFAGTFADLDGLSALYGPSAYLAWHFTYFHALVTTVAVVVLLSLMCFSLLPKAMRSRVSLAGLIVTTLLAALLHLALDACQSYGVALLWPVHEWRVAADWLAAVDPWILVLGVAAIILPELARLVGDEIGSKDKGSHGPVAAAVGLAILCVYVGARGVLHSNVLGALENRSYQGESPRHAAAFPAAASPFAWHSVVETDSAFHEIVVSASPQASFDPESGVTLFKPEASAALELARGSEVAKLFLGVARFPKASVEKTPEGSMVELRDLRYAATGDHRREVVARILLNSEARILTETLDWAHEPRRR